MRTFTFFNAIDASSSQTSAVFTVPCGQDMRFLLEIVKAGTDGDPKLYVEQRIDSSGVWLPLDDEDTLEDGFFLLDFSPMSIKDSYFMGEEMRLRLEPNDNTTGTVSIRMGYKTKV